jgi:hypothetical protein
MRRSRCLLWSSVALSALLALPFAAQAQFRAGSNPSSGYGYPQTQAVAAAACPPTGFNYSPWTPGWGPYQYQTPMNGFLTGAADVMNATGQYEIQHQQSQLTYQQVKSAHIDNRRKMFDELRYEKANTPTSWQVQAEARYEQLQQARNNPPQSEIWAAIPLNLILDDIRQIQAGTGLRGALVPLDPETVSHLNVGTGTVTGSSSLLRASKLKWPVELQDPRFTPTCNEIDKFYQQAIQEAAGADGLTGATSRALAGSIDKLQDEIDGAVNDMTPSDNIRAKTFADSVTKASKLLRDPNVAKQLNGDWAAKGNTVGELVENMNRNGQKFGPAGPADKPFYSSFYQSLLQYDLSLASLASRSGGPPSPGAQQ